ncbi:hypothetical protein [Polystyrenella longa]|nr:hypothetical protein [Polystyrenella longa]
MSNASTQTTSWCLIHQQPETQASPFGKVCPNCKRKLYTGQLGTPSTRYWDSQPGAYRLSGEPCFIYNIIWDNFQIRSLQFAEPERPSVPAPLLLSEFIQLTESQLDEGDVQNITDILKQRGLIQDIVPGEANEEASFDPPELDDDFGLDLPDFDSSDWEKE